MRQSALIVSMSDVQSVPFERASLVDDALESRRLPHRRSGPPLDFTTFRRISASRSGCQVGRFTFFLMCPISTARAR
jgi:hypothetical protein